MTPLQVFSLILIIALVCRGIYQAVNKGWDFALWFLAFAFIIYILTLQ